VQRIPQSPASNVQSSKPSSFNVRDDARSFKIEGGEAWAHLSFWHPQM
jgi:hypothetical protein